MATEMPMGPTPSEASDAAQEGSDLVLVAGVLRGCLEASPGPGLHRGDGLCAEPPAQTPAHNRYRSLRGSR